MKLKSILLAGILAIPALFPTNAKANDIVKEHKELARTIVSLWSSCIYQYKHSLSSWRIW